MKSFSVLVLMMFVISFSQTIVSADKDDAKSPKYKATERTAKYAFGVKWRKDSTSPVDSKGSPVGKKASSLSPRKVSNYISKLQGLSVKEALQKVEDADFHDKAYSSNDSDDAVSFNGFHPGD